MICPQCGNDTFNDCHCSSCGYSISGSNSGGFDFNGFRGFGSNDETFDPAEVNNGRLLAIIGYFFGVLFFLPLIMSGKKTSYGLYHANNAFVLFAANLITNAVIKYTPLVSVRVLLSVLSVALVILKILGIVFAITGVKKKIPIIGEIRIFK